MFHRNTHNTYMIQNAGIEVMVSLKNRVLGGWGFSSVVERLPRKRKALGSVPSSEKKNQKKKNRVLVYHVPGPGSATELHTHTHTHTHTYTHTQQDYESRNIITSRRYKAILCIAVNVYYQKYT